MTEKSGNWLREKRWGLFVHYLADGASNNKVVALEPADWNAQINAFNVEGLADQLAELKVPYFCLTIGQNTGFYLSPNSEFDRLVQRSQSRLSDRDLLGELAGLLFDRGINMIAYLPGHAPALDQEAVEGLSCTPRWDASVWQLKPGTYLATEGIDEELSAFRENWSSIIREWSLRWGKTVQGWWFDGCYPTTPLFGQPDAPMYKAMHDAAKAGNPGSIVTFNNGVKVPVESRTIYDDYTPGEIADALPLDAPWRKIAKEPDKTQLHLLTFMGEYWGKGSPRFTQGMVTGYTSYVNQAGGTITWDIPTTREGLIVDEYLPYIKALAEL